MPPKLSALRFVTVHSLDGNQSGNRKTGRQEGRIGLAGKSPEAVLEDGDVEIYEESNRKASELEVGEHLSLMDGQEPSGRLHFDDEFVL
jgi:hypothetical protein